MFDIGYSEFLLIGIVALVVIGPKDLPRVLRQVGQWVGKARGMARHFRTGIDTMIRESELEEMSKQWAAQNAEIMKATPSLTDPERAADHADAATPEQRAALFAAQDAALAAPASFDPPGVATHLPEPPAIPAPHLTPDKP